MGMNSPTVSVCIPAYRRPETLATAIESVLAQSFDDFEIVVSDDSGNLESAVAGIRDPRIRYFKNERTLGMAGNWNRSLDRASGGYLALLMDDDRWLPTFLERTMARFETEPSIDVVFTNHFFDDGHRLRERASGLAPGTYPSFLSSFLRHRPVAISAAVIQRKVWERVRPLPELWTADHVLCLRAAQQGFTFAYLGEPLMIYRVHAGQLSASPQFRDDSVRLWELFHFDDPECEAMRRRYLAHALLSQAAGCIKAGRYDRAHAAVRRADELGSGGLSLRERAIAMLGRRPRMASVCASGWRFAHRLPRLRAARAR
jgi:glycosyltransferase involved in cell wall biosynthesis